MREHLEQIEGVRAKFVGIFDRFGIKTNWHGFPVKTVLLLTITDEKGNSLTDHLWFNYTKSFEKLGELIQGQKICFEAKVQPYVKGYVRTSEFIDERELDFKLSRPTKVCKIK